MDYYDFIYDFTFDSPWASIFVYNFSYVHIMLVPLLIFSGMYKMVLLSQSFMTWVYNMAHMQFIRKHLVELVQIFSVVEASGISFIDISSLLYYFDGGGHVRVVDSFNKRYYICGLCVLFQEIQMFLICGYLFWGLFIYHSSSDNGPCGKVGVVYFLFP